MWVVWLLTGGWAFTLLAYLCGTRKLNRERERWDRHMAGRDKRAGDGERNG